MSKEHKFPKTLMLIAGSVLLFGLLSIMFHFDRFSIAGQSMFPSLIHGDTCITTNRFFMMNLEYERNDIVIFKKNSKDIVKRIIGVPGDHVQIKEGIVTINGNDVSSHPILYSKMEEVRDVTLAPNQYYVLGDNRPYSQDSRHDGPIEKHRIIGRVLLRWRTWSVP